MFLQIRQVVSAPIKQEHVSGQHVVYLSWLITHSVVTIYWQRRRLGAVSWHSVVFVVWVWSLRLHAASSGADLRFERKKHRMYSYAIFLLRFFSKSFGPNVIAFLS